jgi:hypothetical protein
VARGFIGAYPNMFFQVTRGELERFTSQVASLADREDYTRLVERYGVRRTAPWFWKYSDDAHAAYGASFPVEAGLFDLNRYETADGTRHGPRRGACVASGRGYNARLAA